MAKKIFFEIEFEGTDKVLRRAEQLREAIKAIGTQLKDDTLDDNSYNKLSEDLAKLKAELKDVSQEQQNQVRSFQAGNAGDKSYLQLNATLIELRQQFKRLSEAERNSDLGQLLTAEIQKLDKELKGIDASIGNFQRNVGNYPTTISGFLGNIGQSVPQLSGVQDAIGSISEGLDGIGQSATASGRLIAGAFLGFEVLSIAASELSEFTDAAIETNSGLKELQAITGVTDAELEKLSDRVTGITSIVLDNGSRITNTANDIQNAFKLVGSAEPELLKNSAALQEVTKQAIILQKAGGVDLEAAVNLTTTALEQFNLDADQAGRIVNLMAAASKAGSTEIPQLDVALRKAGVGASLAGVSIEETTAAIEIANAKIKNAESSGTALNNFFVKLSAAKGLPKEAIEQLDKYGISTSVLSDSSATLETKLKALGPIANDTVALSKIFGTESANLAVAKSLIDSATAATEGGNAFAKMTKDITGTSEGMTAAGVNASSLRQRFDNLKNDGINAIVPPLTKIVAGFLSFAEVLSKIPKFVIDNRAAIYGLIVAMVALNSQSIIAQATILRENAVKILSTTYTRAMTISQLGLNAAMKANPIGAIISLIALLVGGLTSLYQNSETVRSGIDAMTNRFIALYERLSFVKIAFAQFVEPLKLAYFLFTDGAVAIEAYKATIIGMVQNASVQFQNLVLRAKALGTQLDLTFSIKSATKNKLTTDLQSIENEIAANQQKIVDTDKIFNDKLRVGREVAAQKQAEENKKNNAKNPDATGLPPVDDLIKKRKELLLEVEKWNNERLKLAKKLVDDLRKAQIENIDSELQKQLAVEKNSYDEKLKALESSYDTVKQKIDEQEKKVLEQYKTSSSEYKKFKIESSAELENIQKYNGLIAIELTKTTNDKVLEIQKKFEEKRLTQLADFDDKANSELLKLTRQRIDLELELTDNKNLLNLEKLKLDKQEVLKTLEIENKKRIEFEVKAKEELMQTYGVGSDEVLAFDTVANSKRKEIAELFQSNALLIEQKYLQDKEDLNTKFLESENQKQLKAIKGRLEQREAILKSDNTNSGTDLNIGLNTAKINNDKALELELNVKFNAQKFEREKQTIIDNLDDVTKRLNELNTGDAVSVNIDEYNLLQEKAESYYNKLSELELQHTEQVQAETKARVDLSIQEFERAGSTISDIIGAFDGLVKAQAAAEQEVINEQIQSKEQQVKKLESDVKNATGVQKEELLKQITNEKEAIQLLTKEKEAAEKRAAQTAKSFAIIQATIQTALNVVKALGLPPAPNIFAAGIAGALGAIQIAAISAQPAAGGGLMGTDVEPVTLSGRRITNSANIDATKDGDNILAVVKRGEVVLNERQQIMLGGATTFASIGVPGFAAGGAISDVLVPPQVLKSFASFEEQQNINTAVLDAIRAINNRIDNIRTYVVIDDLSEVSQADDSIKSKAKL